MKKTIFLSNKEMLDAVGQKHPYGTIVRVPKNYIPTRVVITCLDNDIVIVFSYASPSVPRELELDDEESLLLNGDYPSECLIEKNGWSCKVGAKTRKILYMSIPMKTYSDSLEEVMKWLEEQGETGNVEYYRNNCKLVKKAMEKCGTMAFMPPQ